MFTLAGVFSTNHERNMFILSMIETTSRSSFSHDQMKHVQNGQHAEKASTQKIQTWANCETKCLVEIWADVAIQWRVYWGWVESRIFGSTSPHNLMAMATNALCKTTIFKQISSYTEIQFFVAQMLFAHQTHESPSPLN